MQTELKMLQLQLTRRCNLQCYFCGQDHSARTDELQLQDWLRVLNQLKEYAPQANVVLWGGEPLIHPHFKEIVHHAANLGFPLELITNGSLISHHEELLCNYFSKIYISVDGPEKIHDSIRGKGIFEKVKKGLEILKYGKAELIMMSVMTPEHLKHFSDIPFGLPVNRVILHKMIYLTEAECSGMKKEDTEKWCRNEFKGYEEMVAEAIRKLREITFPVSVEFQPHNSGTCCMEPYRHLHITSNGETSFCTDFNQYSLGNVTRRTLKEIFEGEEAEEFRKTGNAPFCNHCSWRNTEETIIKFKKGKLS